MGKASVLYQEIRFDVRDPDLTQVYVAIEARGDCPVQVQGWHHKTFPSRIPTLEIMQKMFGGDDDPVLWPLNAPPGR
jgi:hypothetical protein